MTEKLKQVIKREVAKLPKENQEAINSLDWAKVAEEIGKKYLLLENEVNDLQVETLLVLIGLENDSFALNIENYVGTSKNEANKMAEEIGKKIFAPISDTLVEKIKKSDKVRNGKPEQNLDFILSGGDYSAFVSPNSPLEEYPLGGGGQIIHPDASATPEEGNETEDLKSKFTI